MKFWHEMIENVFVFCFFLNKGKIIFRMAQMSRDYERKTMSIRFHNYDLYNLLMKWKEKVKTLGYVTKFQILACMNKINRKRCLELIMCSTIPINSVNLLASLMLRCLNVEN
jgi:hypothetical protein